MRERRARGRVDSCAVAVDQIGLVQDVTVRRVVACHVHTVRVDVEEGHPPPLPHRCRHLIQQLMQREQID